MENDPYDPPEPPEADRYGEYREAGLGYAVGVFLIVVLIGIVVVRYLMTR